MASGPMMWRGKELKTMGDVMAAALTIENREQGKRFFWSYIEACPDLDTKAAMNNFAYGFSRFLEGEEDADEKYKRYMSWIAQT